MFLVDDIKGGGLAALAAGAAVLVLAPVLLPVVMQAARPLLKGAIKGGLVCYEKGREAMAEVGEALEDVVAEARAELEAGRAVPAAAAAAEGAAEAKE